MSPPVALVTHGLQFAGPAAIEALCADGFQVLATDPEFSDGAKRAHFEQAHPGACAMPPDEDPARLLASLFEVHGRLDVLLSNDVHPAVHAAVEDASVQALRDTLDALVLAPFRLLQAAIPHFKRQAHGRVVMITSCRTALPQVGGALPDMARAAANALLRSLAIELAPHGIPVNAIAPNFLYSEAYYPRAHFIDDPAGRAYVQRTVPAGRLGRADELCELIRYLARMKGSFHTGTIIEFAGGWPFGEPRPAW